MPFLPLSFTVRCLAMSFCGCSDVQWCRKMSRRTKRKCFQNVGRVRPNGLNSAKMIAVATLRHTHAGIAAGVGMTFSHVCLFVRALTWKRLELSTPNLMHVYSLAVARHALTRRSNDQRSRSHGTKIVTFARLLVTTPVLRIPVLPAAGLHVDTTAYVFQFASVFSVEVVMWTYIWLLSAASSLAAGKY